MQVNKLEARPQLSKLEEASLAGEEVVIAAAFENSRLIPEP